MVAGSRRAALAAAEAFAFDVVAINSATAAPPADHLRNRTPAIKGGRSYSKESLTPRPHSWVEMTKPIHDPQDWRQRAAEARALAWGEWDGRMRRMMTEIVAGYELLAQRDRKRLCRSPIAEIQREIAVCWEVRPARSASE
jgi:hypothetical protein